MIDDSLGTSVASKQTNRLMCTQLFSSVERLVFKLRGEVDYLKYFTGRRQVITKQEYSEAAIQDDRLRKIGMYGSSDMCRENGTLEWDDTTWDFWRIDPVSNVVYTFLKNEDRYTVCKTDLIAPDLRGETSLEPQLQHTSRNLQQALSLSAEISVLIRSWKSAWRLAVDHHEAFIVHRPPTSSDQVEKYQTEEEVRVALNQSGRKGRSLGIGSHFFIKTDDCSNSWTVIRGSAQLDTAARFVVRELAVPENGLSKVDFQSKVDSWCNSIKEVPPTSRDR